MKRLLLLVLLLFPLPCAWGQGATVLFPALEGPNGTNIPFAKLTFCTTPATFDSLGNCTNTISVFKDIALTQPYSSAIQTDGLGNFPPNPVTTTALWFSPAQNLCYTATGSNILNTVNTCKPFSVSTAVGPGSSPTFNAVTAASVNSIQNAATFAGADIFAKANTAMAGACPNGVILIPPGTYSVATTLTAASNCKVVAEGSSFTYTGAAQAIKIQNVQEFEIDLGGSTITGPGTGGATVGILLGIGAGGANTLTQSVKINGSGVLIQNFNKAFAMDGHGANGTYSNVIHGITARANNIGFYLVATSANFANANTFSDDFADTQVSDGWKVDGENGNWFIGCRSENNGGWGFNLPGTQQTNLNTWLGGWSENNTSGDFNSGTAANVFDNSIYGTTINSATRFGGTWDGGGPGNTILPAQLTFGSFLYLPINPMAGTNGPFAVINEEGGVGFVLSVIRSGVNAGNVFIGTPQYPVVFRGLLSQYQGINTVSNGIPVEYATVDLTAQGAAIGTTTLYAVPAAGAGQYRLSWDAKKTTVDGVSSTLGALTIVYTDPDNTVVTLTAGALISAGTVTTTNAVDSVTSTGALIGIPLTLNCKASTNITYAMAYVSNTPGQMKYNLHIKLEAL